MCQSELTQQSLYMDTVTAHECHVFIVKSFGSMMIFVSAPGWRSLRAVVMPNVNSQKSEHCREKSYPITRSTSRLLVKCFQIPARGICHTLRTFSHTFIFGFE